MYLYSTSVQDMYSLSLFMKSNQYQYFHLRSYISKPGAVRLLQLSFLCMVPAIQT